MDEKLNIGCEVARYCSCCSIETAQYMHSTEFEDMVMYECLCCGRKEEEIV